MAFKCVFTYYGGKSKLAHLYPEAKYPTIVEPFAGGAAYALRHSERDVILAEKDSRVRSMWEFLLSPEALELVQMFVPAHLSKGVRVSTLVPQNIHPGLLEILRSECNHGTQGAKGVHDMVTSMGAKGSHRLKARLEFWLPKIQHWKLTEWDFRNLPDIEATWFVDPPYNNSAGKRYREANIDYSELAAWCKSRRGQVIVCENYGADWLPFRELTERRGVRSRYQKSRAMEVVWMGETGA